MADLESIVKYSLFTEVKKYKDGKYLIMDPKTERMYFKKTLSVYSVSVYEYLKEHSNRCIPCIRCFWKENGHLVVIEDMIQGKTLEEIIGQESLSFEEKKRIILEICDGLDFLHDANPPIIHRDIKATNIMITDAGSVMIIDYDAAKRYVPDKQHDTVLIGTQGVAAPEQYGFGQSDERTDIYALGKLMERLIPESAQAMEIVKKATQMQPDDRYQSVKKMKNAVEKLWDPSMGRARHNVQVLKMFVRKKSVKRSAVAVILLALFLAGAGVFREKIYPEYFVRRPSYSRGVKYMDSGEYAKARECFKKCGLEYKNVKELTDECVLEEEKEKEREKREVCLENYQSALNKFADSKSVHDEKTLVAVVKELDSYHVEDNEFHQIKTCVHDVVEYYMKNGNNSQFKQIMALIRSSMTSSDRIRRIGNEICYDYAELLQKYGFFRDAYDEFQNLKDYENATERADELVDDVLQDYLDNAEYDTGIQFLTAVEKNSDDPDIYQNKKLEFYYRCAEACMEGGFYQKSIGYYKKSDGFKNANERINEARYKYCLENQDKPNNNVYKYLGMLVNVNYPGAVELKEKIEEWHVDLDVYSEKNYQVDVKVDVSGGPQGEQLHYRMFIYFKNGSSDSKVSYGDMHWWYSSADVFDMYDMVSTVKIVDDYDNVLAQWDN